MLASAITDVSSHPHPTSPPPKKVKRKCFSTFLRNMMNFCSLSPGTETSACSVKSSDATTFCTGVGMQRCWLHICVLLLFVRFLYVRVGEKTQWNYSLKNAKVIFLSIEHRLLWSATSRNRAQQSLCTSEKVALELSVGAVWEPTNDSGNVKSTDAT